MLYAIQKTIDTGYWTQCVKKFNMSTPKNLELNFFLLKPFRKNLYSS